MKPEHRLTDPFKVPKELNLFVELPAVENDMTVEDIAMRVAKNRARYE